jgi:trans-aconitate methyltransferase
MEWKLYDGPPPDWSEPGFFAAHPWVPPARQAGHDQRTRMAAGVILTVARMSLAPATLSDLGCGDGSLLGLLRDWELPMKTWGYDAGEGNLAVGQAKGLDVRFGDILTDDLDYGHLISCCEVLEHLADPHGFLASLPGTMLVITSPSAETADWHYEHHAWAWDRAGYEALVTGAGWTVVTWTDCDGGENTHGGVTRPQRFQAIFAIRA